MARITVEDCLDKIPNRFQLVLAATYRARMLSQGHAPKIETKNKPGVTALREIAAGEIGLEMLQARSRSSSRGGAFRPAQRIRRAGPRAPRYSAAQRLIRAKFGHGRALLQPPSGDAPSRRGKRASRRASAAPSRRRRGRLASPR